VEGAGRFGSIAIATTCIALVGASTSLASVGFEADSARGLMVGVALSAVSAFLWLLGWHRYRTGATPH
jgi:hypothetical protein